MTTLQSAPATAALSPAPPARRSPGLLKRLAGRSTGGLVRLGLLIIALFWMVPTLGLLVSSLRKPLDIQASGWWSIFTAPASLTLHNYTSLLANPAISRSVANSIMITVPATLLVVIIGALAAYIFAWVEFPGRDVVFLIVVGLLVVPIQVALIPVTDLFAKVGIFGSIASVVLFHVAFGLPFAIFLLRNFFAQIPQELLEAARLDGAGELRLFTRVVLPLGGPAIASLAIFQFLWVWNDMLVALIFANSSAAPLTVALTEQTRQFGTNIDVLSSGAFLSMIIPLVVFFAFQRQFVSGLTAGALK
ncbi:sugar ABC transporter permease [Mangrovactinospora gilvigrisea]|uniref:Sugar ABC transporter permease n=1 Tax=Mangrovactinospora gilvigrisea TaxID=1428644 RepID=A0A1J7CC75_9ACTN|nr:carbohydrate ABC transporter permease [Mangrovactinospora gilvigrisea]OIV39128.1 sugar ABC transporter permease [Mangrovactinospora gilvigrisea]